jgi:hypothetical protein
MTDANTQFFAILTKVGMAKQANADALGIPWKITEMGVGDANNVDPVIPTEGQTRLINEWRRKPLNRLLLDPVNPAVLIAEQVIPADEGGRWIREIGLYDADGDLVAVANCAPSFKPLLSQGSGRTQIVRMNFIVSNTGNIQLKIDPAVVLATRAYVDSAILEVLPLDKVAGTYTKVTINSRGIVQSGSNPTTLAGYGITDALTTSGGDVAGNIHMFNGSSVDVIAAAVPSWEGGVHARSNAGARPVLGGLGAWGNNNNLNCVYIGLGQTPWATGTGNGVRVTATGVYVEGVLYGNGGGLSALNWSTLIATPTSLAGYGIGIASQAEAEAGADTNKPMTALRVFQAINAKVIQATESVLGIVRIASQLAVNTGADDSTAVSPKKLRAGVSMMIGVNGYIALPTWLGGLILQWGVLTDIPQATTGVGDVGPVRDVSFPMQFPTAALRAFASMDYSTMTTTSAFAPGAVIMSKSVLRLQNNYTASPGRISWWAIGY